MQSLGHRWLAWFVGGIAALSAAPGLAQNRWAALTYEQVALAWSAAEVARANAARFEALIKHAAVRGQLGCELECDRLQRIFEKLLVPARAQTQHAQRLPWSLTVLRVPGVEAMAMPNGQVVISELFVRERALSEEALAFVLAHEMAHSILEHERQTLHFARMLLPRDVRRSVADMYVEIEYDFKLSKAIEPLLQQGELEADELGLLMASAAGFAPSRQLEFVQGEAANERPGRSIVHSHPSAAQRLQALVARLPLAERIFSTAARSPD